jgi:hypothetical protein
LCAFAVVAGTRKAGADCGYVNGGGRIRPHEASFDVMAPIAREREDKKMRPASRVVVTTGA